MISFDTINTNLGAISKSTTNIKQIVNTPPSGEVTLFYPRTKSLGTYPNMSILVSTIAPKLRLLLIMLLFYVIK